MLEDMVISTPLLEQIRSKRLITSIPLNQRDVTIKYLQKTLLLLERGGIKQSDFMSSYRSLFTVPQSLEGDLQFPNRWVNRWLYRSFMEAARGVLDYSPEKFYDLVFKETFSDVEDTLISTAHFFDLGFVLKNMNRQNHQWNRLTEVKTIDAKRGNITLRRSTIVQHKEELREFGDGVFNEVLLEDCVASTAAYETLFSVIKDPRAAIIDHPHCEGRGDEFCDYTIIFTPIPLRTTMQRGLVSLVSFLIPGMRGVLAQNKEMKAKIFQLQDEIEGETRHVRQLYQTLEDVADASRRSARHDVVNYERGRNSQLHDCIVENAAGYFLRLKELAFHYTTLNAFFERLGTEFNFNSLNSNILLDRDNVALVLDALNDLVQEIGDFISPFIAETDRRRVAFECVKQYFRIRDEFLASLGPDDSPLRAILALDPFPIEVYYDALEVSGKVVGAFEEQAQQIRQTMEGLSLPLEQIITIARKKASETKGRNLDLRYHMETEVVVPRPLMFTNVMRDLLFNIIDYAGARGEVYAGNAPENRVRLLEQNFDHPIEVQDYIKITDFGAGMPQSKVKETNDYLFGRRQSIETSQNDIGNAGTRDLRLYMEAVKDERQVYCLYSAQEGKGTMVEFFFR